MDVQALHTPNRLEQMAPPPPIRRRLHVPTEPLLFAAVVLMITLVMARVVPQDTGAEVSSNPAPTRHASAL